MEVTGGFDCGDCWSDCSLGWEVLEDGLAGVRGVRQDLTHSLVHP